MTYASSETGLNRPAARDRIVVGVDGSDSSCAALRWAAAEAATRRADLVVVHVWEPSGAHHAPYAPNPGVRSRTEDRSRAQDRLRTAVRRALGPRPAVAVRLVLTEGRPSPVLLAHAQRAVLLILGHHPSSSPLRPALGPVARDCVRRAPCPVVTVPCGSGGHGEVARPSQGEGRTAPALG
ncbi:universal stress protein [Streptomyces sp. NPDC006733]|uniref:universal stress protein n=1 Tax=Streptomyces sp. NPDC006733 TaxID=3155460 RepID=UPI0033D8A58F